MSFQRELEVSLEAAREAAAILRRHYARETKSWEKSDDNPVTAADLESDRAIARHLRAAFPGDALLSEETLSDPARLRNPRVWIIDPMDGTKEFIQRIPEFGVSIALCERGEPVVGVIANPVQGVTLWASRGGGCFRDGARTEVSRCAELASAVVIASRTEISRHQFDPYQGWFKELRPVGSIAWKLACIASGEGDLNISVAPKNDWDVCAGDLLVREAGGAYLAFDGSPRAYNQADPLIGAGMAAGRRALLERFFARQREAGR
jgi:myo-inositol-1(or 4)-monophosphatase